ncbi:hypothetical protein [Streptomyces pseudovenezuelae]|uniref:Uncharacterized protein n=1 Tax=Streptomyces pseudovenezuelae TaxID=67350 RepID=A0ABT6M2H8_9ACTN|nr:hypothetical protein [Streptomyces pseudovenezuelae]MDH6222755.1 hypothetical protein [Streptomyces pseudovenezuelae]
MTSQLRVIEGGAVLLKSVTADPWEFQAGVSRRSSPCGGPAGSAR